MGLIGTGIFQARRDGRWVDVVSEIDPCAAPVNAWPEQYRTPCGFPADFEVVDEEWHPIDGADLRRPLDRGRPYPKGHPTFGRLCPGEAPSWLHADEMLAGVRNAVAWWHGFDESCLEGVDPEVIPGWPDLRKFFGEVARLVGLHGEVRLVFGLTY